MSITHNVTRRCQLYNCAAFGEVCRGGCGLHCHCAGTCSSGAGSCGPTAHADDVVHLQACTTDGAQVQKVGDIASNSCKGQKRMFQWTNSYFIDATSGVCTPRNFKPKEAEW